MDTYPKEWRDLNEAQRWRAALICGLLTNKPSGPALEAVADAVRLMQKKSDGNCHVT